MNKDPIKKRNLGALLIILGFATLVWIVTILKMTKT